MAPAIYYLCALTVAAVLVVAAAGKLARPAATAVAFESLRLPAPRTVARLVPAVELGVAVLLVAVPRVGGAAALLLLAAFTVFLLQALRAGVRAPCRCFGGVREAPISGADVVRNALLGVLAMAAVVSEGPRAPSAGALALVAVVVAAAYAALRLLRGHR